MTTRAVREEEDIGVRSGLGYKVGLAVYDYVYER
jgi:hypothetical protein